MKVSKTSLNDVYLLEPKTFKDNRGHFFESYNSCAFDKSIGREVRFVQDNESYSKKGVLRGLHYQVTRPQAKLVRVVSGVVFDVALDLRLSSTTFGHWYGVVLSEDNNKQLWIPEGFAHGFLVLSEHAKFQYKVTDYWFQNLERCIVFDDPEIGISWPIEKLGLSQLNISDKDRAGLLLSEAEVFKT